MNSNTGDDPGHDDQTGLVVEFSPESKWSIAEGTPGGTPKQHPVIYISSGLDAGPGSWASVRVGHAKITSDEFAATIAHEMLHACAVFHHGESDTSVVWSKGVDDHNRPTIIKNT